MRAVRARLRLARVLTDLLLVDAATLGCAMRQSSTTAMLAPVAEVALRRLRAVEMRAYDMTCSAKNGAHAVALLAPRPAAPTDRMLARQWCEMGERAHVMRASEWVEHVDGTILG